MMGVRNPIIIMMGSDNTSCTNTGEKDIVHVNGEKQKWKDINSDNPTYKNADTGEENADSKSKAKKNEVK